MLATTSEYFESADLIIHQPAQGFRYGTESIALASFCRAHPGQRVAELGSGVGVISCIVAARDRPAEVVAVELQEAMHRIARENVRRNALEAVVRCVRDDYRRFARLHHDAFDVVISNPPFHPAGAGRIPPDPLRATARHELHGAFTDLIDAVGTLLRRGGRFVLAFRRARCAEAVEAASRRGLDVRRMLHLVSGRGEGEAFLAEFERVR